MKFLTARFLVFVIPLLLTAISYAAQDGDMQKAWGKDRDISGTSMDMVPPEKITDDSESRRDVKDTDRKPQLLLKAQSGDGLAKLSWRFINLPATADEKTFRFTVRYGAESDNSMKTLQVGTSYGYILRELRNNQPYIIQVVANSQDQQAVYKSNEVSVVPLPHETQSSRLEKAFSKKTLTLLDKNEPDLFVRDLHQFGYDFFKNSSQVPGGMDNLPVGNDYILGPGDTISLSMWGAINARYDLTVDRNGEIMIPKVGMLKVWGLSYEQGRDVVNKTIGRYYKNYEMSMTLGRLRSIQVFVVGEVEAPGSYPVSSLSTVINALSAAGGPSRNGSLRTIRITRNGQAPQDVDLYDMFLSGDRSKDVRLQNGDTIFVPVIGAVVAVAGEVRRPAIYEIKGTATLPEILKMAGGVTATGFTGRIQVERVADNSARVVLDYGTKDGSIDASLGVIQILDRDMIKVFPVQDATRQVVSLKGNVVRPGGYQYHKGMRLTDLIPAYQTLLPESYLESVEITRLALPDFHRELLTANLRRALAGSEPDNILLQEQDTVKVFSRWEMEEKPQVSVNGSVVNPGTYPYYPGMTVRDLITAAGSPKRNAFLETGELSRIVVTGDKANPSRLSLDLNKALAGDPAHNLTLQPDDVLIVRSVTDWFDASDKFINLKGEVRFPGVYSVARGERLSSVIARAGGYTERAYLRGARFLRRSVRETQQKRMDEIVVRTEKEILQKQASLASLAASKDELDATKTSLDGLMKSVELMRSMKAEGRVVIRLAALDELRKSSFDVVVEGGDELEVPIRPSVVNVLGQVYNPISFVHQPEASDLETYLKKAGGPTNEADTSEMYVIKADGTVFSRQQSSFGLHWSDDDRRWTFGSFTASALEPGDTLVVPQKIEHVAWMREIKDITQILANVALTAGTILIGLR
jgi:protein involved in polysaccharide export with SLBB domain